MYVGSKQQKPPITLQVQMCKVICDFVVCILHKTGVVMMQLNISL